MPRTITRRHAAITTTLPRLSLCLCLSLFLSLSVSLSLSLSLSLLSARILQLSLSLSVLSARTLQLSLSLSLLSARILKLSLSLLSARILKLSLSLSLSLSLCCQHYVVYRPKGIHHHIKPLRSTHNIWNSVVDTSDQLFVATSLLLNLSKARLPVKANDGYSFPLFDHSPSSSLAPNLAHCHSPLPVPPNQPSTPSLPFSQL